MRVKPVFATFYPESIRNNSTQRLSIKADCSRLEERPQSVDKLKSQVISLQTQQNLLNEQLQKQVTNLLERMNKAETNIAKIFECGWMDATENVQIDMKKLETQLQYVQQMILDEELKTQNLYSQQINKMKESVLEQMQIMEQESQQRFELLRQNIDSFKQQQPYPKLEESNDIEKYQKFNEEMSIYIQKNFNDENVPPPSNTISSNSPLKKNSKLQLQLNQEEFQNTAQQSFQFLQSQSLQYQLDNDGYLLLNGDYIYDSMGNRQQLSDQQIRYLNLISK